ncbi:MULTISPECIES: ATP-binding protein [Sorangium]|uniref:ATP-binding protein n=1 Tax=Sorangium TaxID=39643 RepID=UPI003D9C660F
MSSSEVDPALVTALKRQRLGRIAATLRERLLLAEKQSMGHEEMLLMLLNDEIARRDASATDNRVREAGLDPTIRLELWDKTAKVSFDRRLLGGFTSLRFLRADAMLRRLRQSRLDNSRDAEMVALTMVDLLILDDFALAAMSKEESRDVYQLLST